MRALCVVLHRYVGLVMAGFLLLAGLTGSVLAFYEELDAWLNPQLLQVTPPAPGAQPLDPLRLRERVAAQYPQAWVHSVRLSREPGRALAFWLDSKDGTELSNDEVFVDPYTGALLGERKWGDLSQGRKNLLPFVYRLHYSLALGSIGGYVLGIIALLWTLDCFVGVYLTLPARPSTQKTWWPRWRPAWQVRWMGGTYKVNFDLHRAGGLWFWALLLVLGWSSVGFNLQEVYRPVMGTVFTFQETHRTLPALPQAQPEPGLSWDAARSVGAELLTRAGEAQRFQVLHADWLAYDPQRALFRYRVTSDRDVNSHWGSTSVWFDATTGAQRALYLPTGAASGDTVSTWLYALHMATVGGVVMQVVVCVTGLTVALLSVTGVYLWWRKRRARVTQRLRLRTPCYD